MNNEEKVKIYNKGVEAGKAHSQPSPATQTFMAEMKGEIHYIKEKLDKMPTIEGMKLANEELMRAFFCEADKRYAYKETEKIVKGLIWVVLVAVLSAVIGLVLYV
jgi:hypothetical protein